MTRRTPTPSSTGSVPQPIPKLSTRALADLARGAMAIVEEPGTQVNFQVHHVRDEPGYLLSLLNKAKSGDFQPRETLSANMHGATVIISTDSGPLVPEMRALQEGNAQPVKVQESGTDSGTVFRGAARPNPSFIYESADRYEVLIAIETDPQRLRWGHAAALREAMTEFAAVAVDLAHAPILSLQSPVQLPLSRYVSPEDVTERDEKWATTSVVAMRGVLALQRSDSAVRASILKRLSNFCEKRGYGLWVGDLREGHRAGNWFSVVPPDGHRLRTTLADISDHWRVPIDHAFPITLVGPARIGSTQAVSSLLETADRIGVVGLSISSLDDLAFIHLEICGPPPHSFETVDAARVASFESGSKGTTMSLGDKLKGLLQLLGADVAGVDAIDSRYGDGTASSRVAARAGDYQLLAGPLHRLPRVGPRFRRAIWVAWEQRGSDANLRVPVRALSQALKDCGLAPSLGDADKEGTSNLEYLVCRDLGGLLLRGKGKISVPASLVTDRDTPLEYAATKLCLRLEDAWRSRLARKGVSDIRVGVVWREFWLTHGASL